MKKWLCLFCSFAMILANSFIGIEAASYQKMEITMFNVGDGDCIYIEMPNGDDILIDGGSESYGSKIVEQLNKKENNMTLEAVISTHPDAKHMGGLKKVFEKMKVKKFYYPSDVSYTDSSLGKKIMSLAKKEKDCKRVHAKPSKQIKGGNGAYIEFIQSTKNYSSKNEESLMCYVKYNKLDVLLSGDVENGAEYKGLEKINMDIVQAPNHGSKSANSTSFIKKFDPEEVLISTNGKNGLPNSTALNRYRKYDSNIKVYRTDKKGNITIKSDGKTWTWSCKGDKIKAPSSTPSSNDSSSNTSGSNGITNTPNDSNVITNLVYTTKTGKKYHSTKSCRGLSNAKAIYDTDLSAAKNKGLTPCSICH